MIAGTLEIQLLADMARLQRDMAEAKGLVGNAVGAIEKSVATAKAALGGLLAGIVAGLSVSVFASIIQGAIDSAAAFHDLSIQTGVAADVLSGFADIGQYSDVTAEQIANAMAKMGKNMAGATEESKGTGKALEALGINFNDFKRLSADQQMITVAKAMSQFEDGTGKAAVAMSLYGKEGAKMLPFLKDLAVAGDLQAKVTAEQSAMSDNFGDNLQKIRVTGGEWKKELAMGILPAMSDLSDAWLAATNGSGGLRDQVRALSADGTLERWARGAIIGLTYLIDVGQALISLFPLVGKGIAGVVAATSVGLSAAWEAWQRFQKADFEGAWAALKNGVAGVKSVAADASADIAAIWNQELLGEKIRNGMEAAKAARAATNAEAAKAKLDFTNVNDETDKKALAAANKELHEQKKLLAESAGLAGDFYDKWNRLNAMYANGTYNVQQLTAAQAELLAKQPAIKKAAEEEAKAKELLAKADLAAAEAHTKHIADMFAGLDKLKAEAKAQQELNDRIGLTKESIAELDAAKLEEQATTLEGLAIKRLDKDLDEVQYGLYKAQAEELRKLAVLKREGAAKQVAVDQAKAAADAWKKTSEEIERALTDALMRGFEGGKGIAQNFRDAVVNMFKTLILRPIVQGIVQPIAGGVTNAVMGGAVAMAGGNSGNGAFSTVSNLYSGYNMLTGTTGLLSSGTTLGWLTGASSVAPTSVAAANVVGGVGGDALGTLIAAEGWGGAAATGALTATAEGAAAAGTASGTVASGMASALASIPVWGWILLAIAVFGKQLFGHKTVGSGLAGAVNGSDFSGFSYEFQKGGVFRSDRTKYNELDQKVDTGFDQMIEPLTDSFNDIGKAIGAGAKLMDGFHYEFRLALADFDEAGKQKEIQRFMASMTDSMALAFVDNFRTSVNSAEVARNSYFTNTVDGERNFGEGEAIQKQRVASQLDPYIDDMLRIFDAYRESVRGVEGSEGALAAFVTQLFNFGRGLAENQGYLKTFGEALDFKKLEDVGKTGENVMQTFARLNTVFQATNAIVELLGSSSATAFGAVGLASTEARQRLIDLSGGIDALNAGTSFFSQQFMTEAERLAPVQKIVTEEMGRLGYAGVTTHEQFKSAVLGLVDSGALATEAGAKTYAALMRIAPAFDTVADAALAGVEKLSEAEKLAAQKKFSNDETLRQTAIGLADVMLAGVGRAVNAQKDQVTKAYEETSKQIEKSMELVSEKIGILTQRSNVLGSALDRMSTGTASLAERAQAQAFITSARAIVQAGGNFNDDEGLKNALSVVTQSSRNLYGSYEDYMRDQYQTAIEISDLKELTDGQLTAEEEALEVLKKQKEILDASYAAEIARLDGILAAAQAEVDAIKGVDTSVQSLSAALQGLAGALASARAVGAGRTGSSAGNAAISAIAGAYEQYLHRSPEAAGLNYWSNQVSSGALTTGGALWNIANSAEAKVQQMYASVLDRVGEAAGVAFWTEKVNQGMSMQDLEASFRNSDEYLNKQVPQFAGGGQHAGGWRIVGENGPELEYTGPSYVVSNASSRRLVDNSGVESQIKGMRQEIRSGLMTIARHTSVSAKVAEEWNFDGMPSTREE
jgi:hypothetical protein